MIEVSDLQVEMKAMGLAVMASQDRMAAAGHDVGETLLAAVYILMSLAAYIVYNNLGGDRDEFLEMAERAGS